MRTVLFLAFAVITFSGCNNGGEQAYSPYSVSVIDERTLEPVQGAKVTVMCMGMSPYRTNRYATDSSGHVSVESFPGLVAINVEAAGYQRASTGFTSNQPPVVRLKKIE